jgi:hypothetical protein
MGRPHRDLPMKRIFVALALLAALGLPSSYAAESPDDVRERRRIHAEPSAARQLLALPYRLVALTGWPLGKILDWMEETNLPARVGDFVLYPVHHLRNPQNES